MRKRDGGLTSLSFLTSAEEYLEVWRLRYQKLSAPTDHLCLLLAIRMCHTMGSALSPEKLHCVDFIKDAWSASKYQIWIWEPIVSASKVCVPSRAALHEHWLYQFLQCYQNPALVVESTNCSPWEMAKFTSFVATYSGRRHCFQIDESSRNQPDFGRPWCRYVAA